MALKNIAFFNLEKSLSNGRDMHDICIMHKKFLSNGGYKDDIYIIQEK